MKLCRFYGLATFVIGLCLMSCSPEDGKDGTNGLAGLACHDANGDGENQDSEDINGDGEWNYLDCQGAMGDEGVGGTPCWDTDGDGEYTDEEDTNNDGTHDVSDCQGADGENGDGFEELSRFGYVTLNLNGTRPNPDNQPFEDNVTFKFLPIEGAGLDNYNQVVSNVVLEGTVYQFDILRFLSSPDDIYQETYIDLNLSILNPGAVNQSIQSADFTIEDYAVVGDDNKYFIMDTSFDMADASVTNFQISNVNFDTDTNHLTLDYSFTSTDGDENDTDHSLDISGSVDVFLLEDIDG